MRVGELKVEEEGVVQIFLDVEGDLGRRNPTGLKTGHYRAVVGKDDFDGNVEERVVVGVRIVGNGSGKKGCRIKEDFDLAEVLQDVAVGRLDASKLRWKPGASACVVLASGGYPGRFEMGKRVEGLSDSELISGVKVLHAGTRCGGEKIFTNGGRVLGVTSAACSLDVALWAVYEAAARIHFEGMHFRKDIGRQAV